MRRVVVALVIAAALAALLVGGAYRWRVRADAPRLPAGGVAAVDEASAPDALVEDGRAYRVRSWSFSLESYTLALEDMGMGTALDEVLRRTRAELAINGAFFGPKGEVVGLAVSDGVVLSRYARSLGGGVLTFDGHVASLFDGEAFSLPEGVRFGVQCRPRLVVDGAPNVRRDDGKRSERTALCVRDAGRTIEAVVVRAPDGGPSLYALGKYLAARGCESALNLDGGPSTGVAWREGEAVHVEPPRAGIRHAIVFLRR